MSPVSDTLAETVLAEQDMLGEPCHAVCFGNNYETIDYGVCGKALKGQYASWDDILCAGCIAAGEENFCRHCKTPTCLGLESARIR